VFLEATANGGPVPADLAEPVTPFRLAMRGTSQPKPRCIALDGTVGEWTGCMIHTDRPTPCREFGASYEDGVHNPSCDDARARHGLPALTLDDWDGVVR